VPYLIFLVLFLLAAPATLLADEENPVVDSVEVSSVPLPRLTAYTGKGLSFGVGGGLFIPQEECDCLGSWQVQMEYFYTSWLSSGFDVRYFGGNIDSDFMMMYQRYRADVRFHGVGERLDVYLEPYIGFESTSLSEIRKQVTGGEVEPHKNWWSRSEREMTDTVATADSTDDGLCESIFALDGFSVGIGVGVGFNISRYVGLTGAFSLEYNFSDAVMMLASPGVAFNLREVWPWAKKNLRSTWISFEYGVQRYHRDNVDGWSNMVILGVQFGA